MPIDAGSYDPRAADIKQQVTVYTYSEPVQTQSVFCSRHIRFPHSARTGYEKSIGHQVQSTGTTIIRMRRDSKTVQITPDMEIHHDGAIYGILAPQPIPSSERDELEFLCQYRTPS